jgi:mevalonate kinase
METSSRSYYSYGKLLLTSEYLVLHGALALAMPVNRGQSLHVNIEKGDQTITWIARDQGNKWFQAIFKGNNFSIAETSDREIAFRLQKHLQVAYEMNNQWLLTGTNVQIETDLDFNREWGLGTSSTLISNIALMAEIDLFDYYFQISSGSGYDVAAARNRKPFTYQLINRNPVIRTVDFSPAFKDSIYFVYSGNKQSSDRSVSSFNEKKELLQKEIARTSELTNLILSSSSLDDFNLIIREHEKLLSGVLGIKPVKEKLFQDFNGEIKSLGAWGGDFYLVTWAGERNDLVNYFSKFGLNTIFSFDDFSLKNE